MKCKNCGMEIQDDARFCTNCGAAVEAQAPMNEDFDDLEDMEELEEAGKKKRSNPLKDMGFSVPPVTASLQVGGLLGTALNWKKKRDSKKKP